jgi:hypothetical protein
VFGGLYLPHLREAIWRHLAQAEAILRQGESIQYEVRDVDGDGHDEIAIHSERFSAIVSPRRGGAVEEYTVFDLRTNFANVLTRTVEAYHLVDDAGGDEALPFDRHPRAMFLDRVLPADLDEQAYVVGRYESAASWEATRFHVDRVTAEPDSVTVRLIPEHDRRLSAKELVFLEDGSLSVRYEWEADQLPESSWFATELSVARELACDTEPLSEVWSYPIATVAKSERGLEETRQGLSLTPRWPATIGKAMVTLNPHAE